MLASMEHVYLTGYIRVTTTRHKTQDTRHKTQDGGKGGGKNVWTSGEFVTPPQEYARTEGK